MFELWEQRIVTTGSDRVASIDSSEMGAIAIAGDTSGTGVEGLDVLAASLTTDGDLLFVRAHAAQPASNDQAFVATMVGGDVIVAGVSARRIWAARFDMAGELQWDYLLEGDNKSSTYIATGSTWQTKGSLLLLASGDLSEPLPGYMISLDPTTGRSKEVRRLAGPVNRDDNGVLWGLRGFGRADGSLLVAAVVDVNGESDGWVDSQSVAEKSMWSGSWDAPERGSSDRLADVHGNSQGDVVILTEWPTGDDEGYDIMLRVYSADGQERWTAIYSGPDGVNDFPGGVAIDDSGSVFFCGRSEVAPDDIDIITGKVSGEGEIVWVDTWSGDRSEKFSWDIGADVVLEERGFLVVAGYTYGTANDYDIVVRSIVP